MQAFSKKRFKKLVAISKGGRSAFQEMLTGRSDSVGFVPFPLYSIGKSVAFF